MELQSMTKDEKGRKIHCNSVGSEILIMTYKLPHLQYDKGKTLQPHRRSSKLFWHSNIHSTSKYTAALDHLESIRFLLIPKSSEFRELKLIQLQIQLILLVYLVNWMLDPIEFQSLFHSMWYNRICNSCYQVTH